jgi:exodeoxyribonuclease V gamma subunit
MIGSVTFCTMESSRSIPAKVICLIGMNDGTFPGISYEPGFNLISAKPQPCDPSLKNEDRYLFLETLISASEKLYISYIGQHVRDNSIIPPSVIVSEVIDCLEETFTFPEKDIKEYLITKHPLHPFSPDYFLKNSELFSYSMENLKCAEKLSKNENNDFIFLENPLPAPQEDVKTVSIRDLSNFFNNPCKYLLQKRLNISLEIQEESFEDRESFSLDGLERYLVDQALLDGLSAKLNREDLFKLAEAGGMLPHGIAGESIYRTAFNNVSEFVTSLKKLTTEEEAQSLPLDINIGGFRLIGNINSLYGNRLVKHRCAKIKPKDIISLWIEHLTFDLVSSSEKHSSILAGSDKGVFEAWTFDQVNNSRAILQDLLELYYKGLTRPLSLFPEASFAYANKFYKDQDKDLALNDAEKKLIDDEYIKGDLSDAYLKLCFHNRDCLDEEFIKTASAVYEPILKNRKKLKQ